MKYATLALITLASGLAIASAAAAQHGAAGARPAMPSVSAAPPSTTTVNPGVTQRDESRVNRQAPENASPTGIANANENAGLSSTTTADLSGLSSGLTVKDSTGATIGTVSKIEKSKDGTVRNVLVDAAGGKRTIRLAPGSLSVSGDVVTTTTIPK
jgi:hypothetical protein